MSATVVSTEMARALPFNEELMARKDILFVWRIGEHSVIVLDSVVHAFLDRMEVSQLSVG